MADHRIHDGVGFILGMLKGTAFYRPDGLEALVLVEDAVISVSLFNQQPVFSHITFALQAPSDQRVIRTVAKVPSMRMTDLAAQTKLTQSGLSRVVDKLEADGFVQRYADPDDGRGFLVICTDAGYRWLNTLEYDSEGWKTGLPDI